MLMAGSHSEKLISSLSSAGGLAECGPGGVAWSVVTRLAGPCSHRHFHSTCNTLLRHPRRDLIVVINHRHHNRS